MIVGSRPLISYAFAPLRQLRENMARPSRSQDLRMTAPTANLGFDQPREAE